MEIAVVLSSVQAMLNSTEPHLLSSKIWGNPIFIPLFLCALIVYVMKWMDPRQVTPKPLSVNYFFSRRCNKTCVFCFHTEKTSDVASPDDMRRGLRLLKEAGMRKINFAGGEPFLYPKELAMMCRYCKAELQVESVSIISNGSKIKREWLVDNAPYIDILGISCDSFDEETNVRIGRGKGDTVTRLFRIRMWCRELGIKFKLNTVVLRWNWEEDMTATVAELDPFRWKVFQVLPVGGENDASEEETETDRRKRNVRNVLISDEQFAAFCQKHKHLSCFVAESNELMASSYLMLDEYLRFLDKGSGEEKASESILDVGVLKAMSQVRWDQASFKARGGIYEWSKDVDPEKGCPEDLPKTLQW